MSLIRLRNCGKVFTQGSRRVEAVRPTTVAFNQGIHFIFGKSGSGKSTLLALLAGLDQPTRGDLIVGGRNLNQATARELTQYRRETVGVVFQSFNLLPTLTVLENVSLPALLAG